MQLRPSKHFIPTCVLYVAAFLVEAMNIEGHIGTVPHDMALFTLLELYFGNDLAPLLGWLSSGALSTHAPTMVAKFPGLTACSAALKRRIKHVCQTGKPQGGGPSADASNGCGAGAGAGGSAGGGAGASSAGAGMAGTKRARGKTSRGGGKKPKKNEHYNKTILAIAQSPAFAAEYTHFAALGALYMSTYKPSEVQPGYNVSQENRERMNRFLVALVATCIDEVPHFSGLQASSKVHKMGTDRIKEQWVAPSVTSAVHKAVRDKITSR